MKKKIVFRDKDAISQNVWQAEISLLLQVCIRFYIRWISPLFPVSCRFYPSCSHYALEAVTKKGIFCGLWLSFCRILRCHPWHEGGYDPVPNSNNCGHNQKSICTE